MNRPLRLTKPPNEIVTATIGLLTQEHAGQIDDIWGGILRETQQPDNRWDWAYKLWLAANDDRYEAYGIELEALLQGVILLETQWQGKQQAEFRWGSEELAAMEFMAMMIAFAPLLSQQVWPQALMLVMGALLAPGKQMVSQILRVRG